MPRSRTIAALAVAFSAAACGGDDTGLEQDRRAKPDDGVGARVSEVLATWEARRPGAAVPVAVTFTGPLSDSAVVAFLGEHSLRPFAAYISVAGLDGVHREPRVDASLEVLTRARAEAAKILAIGLCAQRGRAAAALEMPPSDERLALLRALTSDTRRIRAALVALPLGAPVIVGVQAVGTPNDIRAALGDPRAPSLTLALPEAPAPEPSPAGPPPSGMLAEVAALPPEAVVSEARSLLRGALGDCHDHPAEEAANPPPP